MENILQLLDVLSSDSSDEEEELIINVQTYLESKVRKIPKIRDYIENVVYNCNEKEVSYNSRSLHTAYK